MKLMLSTDLSLPLDAVTETFAILGRRGSGKTHTAVVMAEEMLGAGVPIVVIDPLDVWWGLRVGKDGKSTGLPIYIAGGSHADIPLHADAGKVLADAIVDRALSIVLSIRHLSKADQRRFVGDLCERLYDRKADPKHRTALHVFIDEADAFVPQRLMPGAERCFGAVDTLVRRGRSSGLAPTLISQRPQVINKDVLSQTEVLVSHQLTGPQDRKALEAWIEANDTDDQRGEFMSSLASLPKGTAWFWSPGFLHIFARVDVRDRRTFDSSATPKAGVRAVASPKAFADVDLQSLTDDIAASIAKAKADDPRELRREIVRLTAAVKTLESRASAQTTSKAAAPRVVEKLVIRDAQLVALDKALARAEAGVARASEALTKPFAAVREAVAALTRAITAVRQPSLLPHARVTLDIASDRHTPSKMLRGEAHGNPRAAPHARPRNSTGGVRATADDVGRVDFALPRAERAILRAAAQLHPKPASRAQLAILSGYSIKSSSFQNALGALRSGGFLDGSGDSNRVTGQGMLAAGDFDPMPSGDALIARWSEQLPKAERALLQVFAQHGEVSKEQLADESGYSITSSSFQNALGRLRTLELVDGLRLNPGIFA